MILAGETGSGKTTQLPKICLELGRESIGHTQPRRLAARTIAERIAEELGEEVGGLVGYQVRFSDHVGAGTKIKLMTDGILLAEIHRDRMLRTLRHDHHRRGARTQPHHRLPARLPQAAAAETPGPEAHHHLGHHRPGQLLPALRTAPPDRRGERTHVSVEIRYRPLVAEATEEDDDGGGGGAHRFLDGINAALDELAREPSGDVLVFLSGENEIRDAEDAIRGRNLPGTEVLPLYGRLSAADQHRVFRTSTTPGIRRRIVLATNVAETSLTVPGIKYVIDAGTARISRYSARAKIQRLPIEAISQASANQRSGPQRPHQRRHRHPALLRGGLRPPAGVHRTGDPAHQPGRGHPADDLARARRHRGVPVPAAAGFARHQGRLDLLTELGAIRMSASRPGITKVGRQLAQLPIDPRLARMVIESKRHGVTREVMAIVAGLSIQDPRERPLEKRPQADTAHARFTDPTSDFLTLLNLWNYLEDKEKELSGNQFRRLCKAEYLNYLRIREWGDLYRQLKRMAKPLGLTVADRQASGSTPAAAIHRSLLAGLLSQHRDQGCPAKDKAKGEKRGDYIGARQIRFSVFPGSALAKKQPAELMTAELVETSRLFARMNAAIDLAWAEPTRRRPRQAQLRRTALGEEPGLGHRLRAGHPVRGADRGKTAGCSSPGSTRPRRANSSSATPWSTASGRSAGSTSGSPRSTARTAPCARS